MIQIVRRVACWALVFVSGFNALSAIAGGIGVIATNGLGMPLTWLERSPFDSFVVPGLVLLTIVGGTQAVAFVLLLVRNQAALVWPAVAGFGMIIWIFVEIAIIESTSWPQDLYFLTGLVQLILVLALLGVLPWLPRAPLEHSRPTNPGFRG